MVVARSLWWFERIKASLAQSQCSQISHLTPPKCQPFTTTWQCLLKLLNIRINSFSSRRTTWWISLNSIQHMLSLRLCLSRDLIRASILETKHLLTSEECQRRDNFLTLDIILTMEDCLEQTGTEVATKSDWKRLMNWSIKLSRHKQVE